MGNTAINFSDNLKLLKNVFKYVGLMLIVNSGILVCLGLMGTYSFFNQTISPLFMMCLLPGIPGLFMGVVLLRCAFLDVLNKDNSNQNLNTAETNHQSEISDSNDKVIYSAKTYSKNPKLKKPKASGNTAKIAAINNTLLSASENKTKTCYACGSNNHQNCKHCKNCGMPFD